MVTLELFHITVPVGVVLMTCPVNEPETMLPLLSTATAYELNCGMEDGELLNREPGGASGSCAMYVCPDRFER